MTEIQKAKALLKGGCCKNCRHLTFYDKGWYCYIMPNSIIPDKDAKYYCCRDGNPGLYIESPAHIACDNWEMSIEFLCQDVDWPVA